MERTFEDNLRAYAHLVIRSGCNLQQGQELFLSADIATAPFARMLVREAYEQGASKVTTRWGDEVVGRMNYDYRSLESFSEFPDWQALMQNGLAKRGAALLFVTSEDPEAFSGIDQRKLVALTKAANEACKDWRDGMDFGRNVWCIVGAASPGWASRVFPDLPQDEAVSKLWDAIFKTVRVDSPDPVAAWEEHRKSFERRRAFLNEKRFDTLHYSNSLGTDFTVGLTPGSRWEGGGSRTVDGTYFFPNMPTEEVFTSPDRSRAEGTIVASMPLNHAGSIVDDFSLTFSKGRVVDFSAKRGADVLEQVIETDEGSHHLGEVALIPCTSPIRQTGVLFLNTLFDENAACHVALGMGFPDCYEGGLDMDKQSLQEAGINDSATHVDFMLGTDDLDIVGTTKDGEEIQIFRNGTWAFED
jgi:aminopeptidase